MKRIGKCYVIPFREEKAAFLGFHDLVDYVQAQSDAIGLPREKGLHEVLGRIDQARSVVGNDDRRKTVQFVCGTDIHPFVRALLVVEPVYRVVDEVHEARCDQPPTALHREIGVSVGDAVGDLDVMTAQAEFRIKEGLSYEGWLRVGQLLSALPGINEDVSHDVDEAIRRGLAMAVAN